MNKPSIAASVLGLLLASGCAMPPQQQRVQQTATPTSSSQLELRDKITATAIVHAVDLDQREVVLRGKGGKLHTVRVDEAVQNLPQVKVGDRVELTYYEALAVDFQKYAAGLPPRKETLTVERALPGERPAGSVRKDITVVADVTAVNQKTRRVSLLSENDAVTMKVPDNIDISMLRVGDQIQAHYVRELAVAVEPMRRGKMRR
ncbi:MAG TPA: hypothetical protein PLP22_06315 [Candidatus Competibacter sp.]|nr:hypothetical protein [Candidatus Competibacteraceae bacterium]HRE54390.1 hypothetical protein [Candidatus Competibacter sp.]HUM94278.1 hypothetical protein [Candidatus Competibacter sp.]